MNINPIFIITVVGILAKLTGAIAIPWFWLLLPLMINFVITWIKDSDNRAYRMRVAKREWEKRSRK